MKNSVDKLQIEHTVVWYTKKIMILNNNVVSGKKGMVTHMILFQISSVVQELDLAR